MSGSGILLCETTLRHQPIQLFFQKPEIIRAYCEEEKTIIRNAKVIMLGDGDVGKTFTLKRLLSGGIKSDYPTSTTHGVLIKPLLSQGEETQLNIWDFGGQQIMHSMHRCFLTQRTCYVVMVDNRRDGNNASTATAQAEQWLAAIRSFSASSPVIVLTNQKARGGDRANEAYLQKRFPEMDLTFLCMDAKECDQETFLQLRAAMMEKVKRLDSYGMQFPKRWYKLWQDIITKNKAGESVLCHDDFYDLCRDNEIWFEKRPEERERLLHWLLDWFNDLGICFSYHHDNGDSHALHSYYLLDPEWLTNAAYILVCQNNEQLEKSQQANGIMDHERIREMILNTHGVAYEEGKDFVYKQENITYILEVLHKLEICYSIGEGQDFFPCLLKNDSSGLCAPDWFDPKIHKKLRYVLRYPDYLPSNVIHSLIIRCLRTYPMDEFCKTGFRLNDMNALQKWAVTVESTPKNEVEIEVYSEDVKPYVYFSLIRGELMRLNKQFGITAKEYIRTEHNDFFEMNRLFSLYKKSPARTEFGEAAEGGEPHEYAVRDLLGLVADRIDPKIGSFDELMYVIEQKEGIKLSINIQNVNNLNNFDGNNGPVMMGTFNGDIHNGLSAENVRSLLEQISEQNEDSFNARFEQICKTMEQHDSQQLQEILNAVKEAAPKVKKKTFLEKANAFLTAGKTAAEIGTIITALLTAGG